MINSSNGSSSNVDPPKYMRCFVSQGTDGHHWRNYGGEPYYLPPPHLPYRSFNVQDVIHIIPLVNMTKHIHCIHIFR